MKDDMDSEQFTIDMMNFVRRHDIIPLETDGFRKLQRAYGHLRDMKVGELFVQMTRGEERCRFTAPKNFELKPSCYLVDVTDCHESAVVENRNREDFCKITRIWLPYQTSEFALLQKGDNPIGIYVGRDAPETKYGRAETILLSLNYSIRCKHKIGE